MIPGSDHPHARVADFTKTLHVLIIENNPVDCAMLSGMLSKSSFGSFRLKGADSLKMSFQILAEDTYHVVLLDLNLKDSSGLDTLHRLHKKFPEVAIVVNTGVYQDSLGLKAIICGAQDYLIKGKYKAYGLVKALYYAVERKRAEEELKAAYNRLKETQAQLIQVEKMTVIGGLASGIAHEVKNPLATILYGVEFLDTKLTVSDPQIQLTLKSIREATQKANDIIKDLLDFASLSKLTIIPESINTVIEHSLHFTTHQCDRNGIRVEKFFASNLPDIPIDKNRIEQVIVDLIINAILAMPQGGLITIRTLTKKFEMTDIEGYIDEGRRFRPGDDVVIIDIEDTGPGIETKNLPKVFDPFFTTRRAAGGVGLGLSIAKTIINNHEGIIFLSNHARGGTRARLILKTGALS